MVTKNLIHYFVHYINLPLSVDEETTKNEDESYSIFINKNISKNAQNLAFIHALQHIQNEDFNKENVNKIEINTHNVTESMLFLNLS